MTTISLLIFMSSQAQIEKGSNAIGINLGGAFSNPDDKYSISHIYEFTVQPVFEHFISKNLSLGASINCDFQFKKNENTGSTNVSISRDYTQEYQIGIQLKKYWFPIKQLGFTLAPQVSYNYIENNYKNDYTSGGIRQTSTSNYNLWYYSGVVNMSAVYFIKPNIGIELQTNLAHYSFHPSKDFLEERTSFSVLAFKNNATLGIKYILDRRTEK